MPEMLLRFQNERAVMNPADNTTEVTSLCSLAVDHGQPVHVTCTSRIDYLAHDVDRLAIVSRWGSF